MPEETTVLSLSRLPRDRDTGFLLEPETAERQALAAELELNSLKKIRFSGMLRADGAKDWRLEATLGATVVQPCVVTLRPVTTRIDVPVSRHYLADMPEPDPEEEYEMPEDDSLEPLPATLDLSAVMAEALALNLPLYPRADDADLGEAVFAPPGVQPMRDEDAKPLAGLAALKARIESGQDGGEDPES